MSNLRSLNLDQGEGTSATIGFRFHANAEELEEVQSTQIDLEAKNHEGNLKPEVAASEILDGSVSDAVKEQRNLFGKRSISVDSAYESPFSNPIETWKKLNVLKEKITKTVEEKILEMKIDRSVLSKSSRSRLSQSKDNSSISDSEDTSESSKISDHWKNAESQASSFDKTPTENPDPHSPTVDANTQEVKNVQSEMDDKESESELRNRKNMNFPELINLPNIKIATAKTHVDGNLVDESLNEEVESGVEADENLDGAEDSINLDGETTTLSKRDSNNPPNEENIFQKYLNGSNSVIFPKTNIIILIFGITLYFCFHLPEFFRGFLFCLLIVTFWGIIKNYFQMDDFSQQQRPFIFPCHESLPPLEVPKSKPIKGIWFNEYEGEIYDPEYYSVTQTVPAYLELEDSILMVSRPKGKISRRATFDEPEYKLPIQSKRIYNISGCSVFLLPDGLTRKRLFSKKYPIVIFLKPEALLSEKKNGKEIEEKETHDENETEEQSYLLNADSPKSKGTLYLFARCDRQKEEWYRRLLSATRLTQKNDKSVGVTGDTDNEAEKSLDESPKEPCTPFENLFFDNEEANLEEYSSYMANFVHFGRSSENSEKPDEGKSGSVNFSGDQVMWFNAVVNRILFDVFRSPHWHSKIQEKVYRKLNSVRLPYYIENIEVVELDLGKTGPMFHRVSQPYIDERGLWFDMELSFDGLIRLTIQTHLNLIKLQKGMDESEVTTPSPNEKLNKGKKSQRTDREPFLIKESNQMSAEHEQRKSKSKMPKNSPRPSVKEESEIFDFENSNMNHSFDSQLSEEFSKMLLSEMAQFTQMALKEDLSKPQERSPLYDSDLEDSAESSDEDEEDEEPPQPPAAEDSTSEQVIKRYPKNRRSSKRIFKVFENVAQSKYFRSVAQSKYIQKAIAGVSAAKLRLTLEIKSCTGVLTVNIPPPPSDRFWYGFREMPKLVFSANPKIGDKALRFVHIRNYFQKKILHELKAKAVLPNMLNKVCPLLSRRELLPEFLNVPSFPKAFGNIEEHPNETPQVT